MDIVSRARIGDFSPENCQNLVISGQNLPFSGNFLPEFSYSWQQIYFFWNQELVNLPRIGK